MDAKDENSVNMKQYQGQKVIRDSVHGYIYIDKDIFEFIIDTEFFQRLRRIEQTSMRCLYPAARHDRFIHSIGVYHLGMLAINVIEKGVRDNAERLGNAIPEPSKRKNLNFTFEMAALLHDVAHAPFSHTLEDFYGVKKLEDIGSDEAACKRRKQNLILDLCDKLKTLVGLDGQDLERFLGDISKAAPASHEIMSSLLILECFVDSIKKVAASRHASVDWEFLVRCITGALYRETNISEKNYRNCIIRLLNSSIDIDKLDYISRDSSISGYDNVTIDIQRLLRALIFVPYENENGESEIALAFNKTAISVVQNTVLSRNALYTWIYAHHKVKYETYLIKSAIDLIVENKNDDEKVKFFEDYFSLEALKTNLICDDDIWCLFKQNRRNYEQINEIFQRNKQRRAIWKSFNEFETIFSEKNAEQEIGSFSIEDMREMISNEKECKAFLEYLNEFGNTLSPKIDVEFLVIVHNVKLTSIKHNNILVYLNNKLYGYDVIIKDLYPNSVGHAFFYLFCDRVIYEKVMEHKEELIDYIKKYHRFHVRPIY